MNDIFEQGYAKCRADVAKIIDEISLEVPDTEEELDNIIEILGDDTKFRLINITKFRQSLAKLKLAKEKT